MNKLTLNIIFLSFLFSGMHRPADDATLAYTHVLFEWDQIEDAYEYEIQISNTESFGNILVEVFEPSLIYIDTDNLDILNTSMSINNTIINHEIIS